MNGNQKVLTLLETEKCPRSALALSIVDKKNKLIRLKRKRAYVGDGIGSSIPIGIFCK